MFGSNLSRLPGCIATAVLAVAACTSQGLADGAECIGRSLVSTFELGRPAYDIDVVGDLAYVAAGDRFLVLDISTPWSPQVLASVPTGGIAYSVAIGGAYAYLAVSGVGLLVYDLTSPGGPTQAGSLAWADSWSDIALDGDIALMAGLPGVLRIDVSDPTNPVDLAAWGAFGETWFAAVDAQDGIACSGGLGFMGSTSLYICTYDLEPLNWQMISAVNVEWIINDIKMHGDVVYVASGGLTVIDMSDPHNAYEIETIVLGSESRSLDVQGNRLAVTTENEGVIIFDISDPRHPREISRLGLAQDSWSAALHGSLAFVGDGGIALAILDLTTPRSSPIIGHRWVNSQVEFGPFVFDDLVVVSDWRDNIRLFDIADPSEPRMWSTVLIGQPVTDVDRVDDTLLLAAGTAGMPLYDVSDPASPLLRSTLTTPGTPAGVKVRNGLAYIADGEAGLVVADVSDVADPAVISTTPTNGRALGITLAGDYALVRTAAHEIEIFSLSNPTSPMLLGAYLADVYISNTALSGTTLFVQQGYEGIEVVDLTDPSSPQLLAEFTADFGFETDGMAATHDRLYLVGREGIIIYDTTDASRPLELVHLHAPDRVEGIELADGYGVLIANSAVVTIDLSDCSCLVDIAPPLGRIDFFDVQFFLSRFSNTDPRADLDRDGSLDVHDVLGYLDQYSVGCW